MLDLLPSCPFERSGDVPNLSLIKLVNRFLCEVWSIPFAISKANKIYFCFLKEMNFLVFCENLDNNFWLEKVHGLRGTTRVQLYEPCVPICAPRSIGEGGFAMEAEITSHRTMGEFTLLQIGVHIWDVRECMVSMKEYVLLKKKRGTDPCFSGSSRGQREGKAAHIYWA